MTAAFIVTKGGKQVDKAIVDKDHFVIGRTNRADLVLDDTNISREHAILLRKDDGYHIQDRGSRNGTTLNGTPLTALSPLSEGDKIVIGPFQLQFIETAAVEHHEDDDEPKTAFMSEHRAKRKKASSKKAPKQKAAAGDNLRHKLAVVAGPLKGTTYDDWEGALTFGRGDDNNVVLLDDGVSQSHAKLCEEDGAFFVEDLGSSNGTFVQGVRIKKIELKNAQQIRIGSSTFAFSLVDAEKKKFTLALVAVCMLFICALFALISVMSDDDSQAPYINGGIRRLKAGNYVEAKADFERVLEVQPGHAKAKKYLAQAKELIAREQRLNEAVAAAEKEDYDTAMDICFELTRRYPKYKKAKEHQEIFTMIKNASIAFNARNWNDAVRLMRKALKIYPDSALLTSRMAKADAERVARDNLIRAKDLRAHKQSDSARDLLLTVPANSAYYAEARGILTDMGEADTMAYVTSKATKAYQQGNVPESLSAIQDGLRQSPGNKKLIALRQRIDQVVPLAKQVDEGQLLQESDDIKAINKMSVICENLVTIETDRLNYFRTEAEKLQTGLKRRLSDLEQMAVSRGQTLYNEGENREAYKHFMRALEINPANKTASATVKSIRDEIIGECRKFFKNGRVHEELEQFDRAIAAYEKVVEIGLEGDTYYVRAKAKLTQLRK